ncbi:MAG: right-handed parallel beta-helix repeat-containing protein [Candidatus Thorarchaeota archaeon]
MKKLRNLTLIVLVFMFIIPSVIQFGSNPNAVNIDVTKKYAGSYDHHDQIWIQSDAEFHAQAAAESWDGNGSPETPYIITGYLFDCESQPLRIWHTTVYWIFTDNIIDGVGDNVQCGTWIENVTHGVIHDNEVFNRHSSLAIAGVEDFNITNNYIHDCWGNGIELFGHMNKTIVQNNNVVDIGGAGVYSVTSRDSVVKDNTITRVDNIGIALLGLSPNCNITGNTVTDTGSSGIMISNQDNGVIADNTVTRSVDYGIYSSSPETSEITDNTISYVDGKGLRFSTADNCEASGNAIEHCTDDGIYLYSGSNTNVHHNTVFNVTGYSVLLESGTDHFSVTYNTFEDSGETCQVCDDGTSNTVSYNYYDDWDTPDNDQDGYVDTPYAIDGSAGNQDEFPIADDEWVPITTDTETTSSSTTTETGTDTGIADNSPLGMEFVFIAGGVGAIVLVAGMLMLKRR